MGNAVLKNCPVCQKPAVEKYRPFCCARCADIDLGSWLTERYRVPTDEAEDMPEIGDNEDHNTH